MGLPGHEQENMGGTRPGRGLGLGLGLGLASHPVADAHLLSQQPCILGWQF